MPLDPHLAALRARIGAYALHKAHDPRATTAKARATFLSRFERDVDPDGVLPEAERRRRAEAAKKEHFARLALRSAKARAAKAGAAHPTKHPGHQPAPDQSRDGAA
jgi:hypothetical protein